MSAPDDRREAPGGLALAEGSEGSDHQASNLPPYVRKEFSATAARGKQLEEYCAGIPDLSRGIVRRAIEGNASPRGAIKAMCLSCAHYQRAEITHCTVWRCPLWLYRPYRSDQ